MTKILVHLKKRSGYANKVVANCFIKTGEFSDVLGEQGEVHVFQARLLTPDEFNAERAEIFSSRMQAKTGEVPTVLMVEVADAPAPGEAKKPARGFAVQSASSAAMAAAAESAEPPAPAKAKAKQKTKE